MLGNGQSINTVCRHYGISRDTFVKFRRKHPSVQKTLDEKETTPKQLHLNQ